MKIDKWNFISGGDSLNDDLDTSEHSHIRDVIYDDFIHLFIDFSHLSDDCLPDEIFHVELVKA